MLRLQVHDQDEDAVIYTDDDGVTVLAVRRGLLPDRAELVLRRAIVLLGEHLTDVVAEPKQKACG